MKDQYDVLARVACEALSRFYETEHRTDGVEVGLGATVTCIEGSMGAPVNRRPKRDPMIFW